MNKPVVTMLSTVAIVVVSVLALRAYQAFAVQKAVDDLTNGMGQAAEQQKQKAAAQKLAREQSELETNTMCALNSDSGKCICRDRRNGRQIEISYDECVKSALN